MDQEPESHIVGVVIALLTSIILILVAAIMFIVARNKRTPRPEVLNSLQHNFNQDTLRLGLDKRGNNHMKVRSSNTYIAINIPTNKHLVPNVSQFSLRLRWMTMNPLTRAVYTMNHSMSICIRVLRVDAH